MISHDAIDALTEEYESRFIRVLQQVCMCRREYERNKDLLRLLGIGDEVARCVKERRPCNLGFIEVRVVKRFLGHQVTVILDGREVSIDEVNRLLSTARFFKEWYDSDCSIDSFMQPMIGADHYDAIKEFLTRNLEELRRVCDNAIPNLNLNGLPTYVANGIANAINDFARGTVGKV
jgi:hypothetical protein